LARTESGDMRDARFHVLRAHQARMLKVAVGLLVAWAATPANANSTGTAFAVADDGTLVTNEHVVAGCPMVRVRQGSHSILATIGATDRADDLAIIKLREPTQAFARLRAGPALRPGEQVIAYGFPLSGALTTEGNLTVGYVSALRGLRDDERTIQITAPVQAGNSGGPLVDMSGNIVGVVKAKLDAVRVMRATGDVPQNVNFAVSLERLRQFLHVHQVPASEDASTRELRPADVGDRARQFTYLVECQGSSVARAQSSAQPSPVQAPGTAQNPADGCSNEVAASRQLLQATHAGVVAAANAPGAVRCQAIRRHYTAMVSAREVVARCDTSQERTEHTAKLDQSIDQFRRNMPADCQP
jgi:S1-C subfamily serine protease